MQINRSQYRCSFKLLTNDVPLDNIIERCREKASALIKKGELVNVSFYRYENMGFLYIESVGKYSQAETLMADLKPYLKPWPEEDGDRYFAPMINVYYHHVPDEDLDIWEKERTTDSKTRVGRVAFVYPDKLPSYVMHHKAIVDEGLLMGDKYAYISMHENLLFSYYEEPRNNVNIRNLDEKSVAIEKWMEADPESHFDREKAKGSNFLVIPCLFSVDRVDG
ncbi:hypothetical protein [Butyrivibrio sp. VCB2006]|uniref:hypothetical protein n=1 Tax=Butyrivibrio sp. VCB2006 TaxID=1280679 RepID=UPI00041B2B0A|nr:hypothetical protein [Butyrivibrio sp. VCB2006]